MTNSAIQILLLEDNPADVLLLSAALEEDDQSTFSITVAERLSDGLDLLGRQPFNIVLLDLGLPDSQGIQTFDRLHQYAENLPVIIFSGNANEDDAVQAVRHGAQDYLIKSEFAWKMAPRAIRYALERQKVHAALQASEKHWRTLIEQNNDAIAVVSMDGTIVYESPAVTRILGYAPEELIGRKGFELVPDEDLEATAKNFVQILENPNVPIQMQMRFKHKNGGVRWVEATSTNRLGDPELNAIVVNYHDITERKQIEQVALDSENRYRSLFENAAIPIWEEDFSKVNAYFETQRAAGVVNWRDYFDKNPDAVLHCAELVKILSINEESLKVFQLESIDQISRDLPTYFTNESWPVFKEELVALAEGNTRFQTEIVVVHPSNQRMTFLLTLAVPADYTKNLARVLVSFIDITTRKQIEEELRISEDKFSKAFKNSPDLIMITRLDDGKIIEVNQSVFRYGEFAPEEMLGKSVLELNMWDESEDRARFTQELQQFGRVTNFEAILRKKSGESFTALISGEIIQLNGDLCILSIIHDISERKEMEEKLRQSEALFSKAFTASPVGTLLIRLEDQHVVNINDAALEIIGFTNAEDFGKPVTELGIHIADPKQRENITQSIANNQSIYNIETQLLSNNGLIKDIILSIEIVEIKGQKHLLTLVTDNTERKQATEKLRQEQSRLELVLEGANAGMWDWNVQTGETTFNQRWAEIVGYALDELEPTNIEAWDNLCHPDDLKRSNALLKEHFAGKTARYECEARMQHKNGNWVWVFDSGKVVEWDANGKPLRMTGVHLDISKRKQTEAELKISQERSKNMIDFAMDAIVTTDGSQTINTFNTAAEKMFGYKSSDALGKKLDILLPIKYQGTHRQEVEKFGQHDNYGVSGSARATVTGVRATGEEFPCEISLSVSKMNDDKLYTAIIRDVSERVRAEEALRQSETLLSEAQRVAHIGHWQWTSPEKTLIGSDEFFRIFELPHHEYRVSREAMAQIVHPDDRDKLAVFDRTIFANQEPHLDYEFRVNLPGNRMRWVHQQAHVTYKNGKPARMMGTVQDITERKLAEENLQQALKREQLLGGIVRNATIMIAIANLDGTIAMVNPAMAQQLGYAEEELLTKRWADLTPPQWRESELRKLAEAAQTKQAVRYEKEYYRKDGSRVPVELVVTPQLNKDGNIEFYFAFINDITERKRTEQLVYAQRDLARVIGTATSENDAWALCFNIILQTTGLDSGGIYLFQNDGSLNLVYRQGLGDDFVNAAASYSPEARNVQLIRSGQAFYFNAEQLVEQKHFTNENLQSVAAIPIRHQGSVVGSINIASHTLKEIPQHTRDTLETISTEIGNIVVYMQTESALRASEKNMNQAQAIAHIGSWAMHIKTNTLEWSAETYRIFEVPIGQKMDWESFVSQVHPEDIQSVLNAWSGTLRGTPCAIEYRIITKSGKTRWVYTIGEAIISDTREVLLGIGVIQDITERKRAESALRESEHSYRSLFENMLNGFSYCKMIYENGRAIDFAYLAVNRAFETLTGLQNVTGKKVSEVIPGIQQSDAGLLEIYERVSTSQMPEKFERHLKALDMWFSVSVYSPERGYFVAVFDVVTERKRAEEALRASEENYRNLIENSHDLIQSVENDGHFQFVNRAWLETLEYSTDEVSNLNLWDIIHPDSRAQCEREFNALFRGESTDILHPIFISKTGTLIDVEGIGVPRIVNGKTISTDAFFRNVTEQRKITRIQTTQFAVSRILAESPEIEVMATQILKAIAINLDWQVAELWMPDADNKQLVWQSGWHTPGHLKLAEFETQSKAHAFSPGEGLPGRAWVSGEVIWGADAANALTKERAMLAQQADLNTVIAVPIVQGQELILGVMLYFSRSHRKVDTSLLDALADLGRQIGQFIARKQAEADLKAERALLASRVRERTAELSRINLELNQAVRAKDEFLANMSHELRTPLNAILGLSESLLEQLRGPLNERQQISIQNIEASGRHLLSLINDILDISKVEAGRLDLQMEPVIIADVAHASLVFVREIAQRKHLKLSVYLDYELSVMQADPKRLKQMLVNLLSNAVKFTPEGGEIHLNVSANPETGVIYFVVKDTGIGISPEGMSRLFQPFTQLDSSLSRQYEGTGLGLALVRRLAELHGGSISVESEPNKGSTFTIALPYEKPQLGKGISTTSLLETPQNASASLAQAPSTSDAPQILLAEDNEINLVTIGDYLVDRGYQVTIARNGREAIDLARETNPHLILMDIQMPEIDGLEATRQLRAQKEFAHTPIIALTALAMPGDQERCLAAGANAYLTKPVSVKTLIEIIQSLLNSKS